MGVSDEEGRLATYEPTERSPLLPRRHHSFADLHKRATSQDDQLSQIIGPAIASGPSLAPAPAPVPEPITDPHLPTYRQSSPSNLGRVTAAGETVGRDGAENTVRQKVDHGSHYMGDYSNRQFWLIFGGVLFQQFVTTFDSTLMASSHPVITSYFVASNSASWLSTAFMLTSAAFQPLFSRVSDTFGRRRLYLFVLCVFMLTTAWCALAQSIESFIAARAFAGFGAGGVIAMGSIITNDLIKIQFRGTYQAYINIFFGLGSACGAAFGGLLCDTLGWRWTFGIQLPPTLIITVLAFLTTPKSLGPQLARNSGKRWYQSIRDLDLAGFFFLTCTTTCLILGVNLGGNVLSWTHPLVLVSLCTSVLAAALLIRQESRAKRPIMPLHMVFHAPRGNLVFSNFFAQIGLNTVIFNAPLYFQAVKLDTPSASGLRLGIASALLTTFAVATGFSITWTGRMKVQQVAGAISMLTGAVCLSSMWSGIPSWLATLFIVPPSVGQGLMLPTTSVAALATSLQADQAVMTTTLWLWRNLGTVLGVAISSGILQNSLVMYLDKYVTGPAKEEIIELVRKSVRSIIELEGKHQAEVITAYESALRATFISAIFFFVLVNILIVPVKLPRLGKDKVLADVVEE